MNRFLILLALAIPGRVCAQNLDSLFAGRHCNRALAHLHIPTLGEIGDSAILFEALRDAADTRSDTTTITLTYRPDGTLKSIKVRGARSENAAQTLEATLRTATRPLVGFPKNTTVTLFRLNAEDRLTIGVFPVTCPPEQGNADQAMRFLRQTSGVFAGSGRTTVVRFQLEPTGAIARAWVSRSSGIQTLDSLALIAVRLIQYKPPLVGVTPLPVTMQQPFTF